MTDAELTALTAKAFGGAPDHFSPLTDPGDALRLAVALELDIMCASVRSDEHGVCITIEAGIEPLAATMRAITRAAAEIGRTKT